MNISIHDLDWKNILIKKYKDYGLNETETMVIFLADSILSIDAKAMLTPEILSSYMTIKKEDIDAALSGLINKGIIELCMEKGSFFSSIDGFKQRLFDDVVKDLSFSREKAIITSGANFYNEIEQMTQSTLSPFDRDRVTTWLRNGATEGMVKEAIEKSMTANGNINFGKADKLILEMERGKSREELGSSTVNEETSRNEEIRNFLDSNDWTYHGGK